MTYKPDPRTVRTFGPYTMVSERDGDLTAHLVSFPDGRSVRVLPDDRTSGQKRSRVATAALQSMCEYPGVDSNALYTFVGWIVSEGLSFELELGAVTIDEWLTEWFEHGAERFTATALLEDLEADGWSIVRKGDE